MSWSSQRRFTYLLGLLIALALIVGVPGYFAFRETPTCTDGIQNGDEDGVDCGGGCPVVCSFSAAAPIVRWDRFFEVIPGVYAALALVENPNASVGAVDVPYAFKLRDVDNVLVYEQKGRLYLPPKTVVPVFVTGLQTGSRVPTRSEFLLGEPVWEHQVFVDYKLRVSGERIEGEGSRPVLTASIRNTGDAGVGGFSAVAILYDADGNALQASETIVDPLAARAEASLVFTWPAPLGEPVRRIDIIPVFPPPAR